MSGTMRALLPLSFPEGQPRARSAHFLRVLLDLLIIPGCRKALLSAKLQELELSLNSTPGRLTLLWGEVTNSIFASELSDS